MKFLGKFHHPNLVKLLGYCWEENQFLLVYEYLTKGSLESHLFASTVFFYSSINYLILYNYLYINIRCACNVVNAEGEALTWDTRLKIAIEAAQGLAFLHNSEKSVIYRDFKASNILLDSVRCRFTCLPRFKQNRMLFLGFPSFK